MITEMYYDTFAEDYTLHTDPYDPPERYIKILRMDDAFYVEHWMDDAGKELSLGLLSQVAQHRGNNDGDE